MKRTEFDDIVMYCGTLDEVVLIKKEHMHVRGHVLNIETHFQDIKYSDVELVVQTMCQPNLSVFDQLVTRLSNQLYYSSHL